MTAADVILAVDAAAVAQARARLYVLLEMVELYLPQDARDQVRCYVHGVAEGLRIVQESLTTAAERAAEIPSAPADPSPAEIEQQITDPHVCRVIPIKATFKSTAAGFFTAPPRDPGGAA